MRFHGETLQAYEVLVFADEPDIHLWPQVGVAWMPRGTQEEMMTPDKNAKHSLAVALHLATRTGLYCLGPRQNNGLFRDLVTLLDSTYPARQMTRISVVVDNNCIHKAQVVEPWWIRHPRFALLGLPTSGRRANPMERVYGDVHDKCTRNQIQKRLRALGQAIERRVQANGP
jgi:hypothetical protein